MTDVTSDPRGEPDVQKVSRVERIMAQRMAHARATIPDTTLWTTVDMTAAAALRAGYDAPRPSFNDLVIKASALALREFPRANSAWRDGGELELFPRVNVGFAVAHETVLVVPAVFDADRRALADVAGETRRLAQAVRAGKVAPDDLAGGTFTVSNLGMYGIDRFTAIINPPQVGILSVGRIGDGDGRPMAIGLTSDHRVLFGAYAARFLGRIRALLEAPQELDAARSERVPSQSIS
jgi:pyruvate dehydrogenase E2 component (dihydrolipoamide acetyltransferase)